MLKKLFIIAAICLLLVSCGQNKQHYAIKAIETALNTEVATEKLIFISYPEQEVAIYEEEDKIHFYVFEDKKTIAVGFVSKADILDLEKKKQDLNWYSFGIKDNRYGIWGIILHSSDANILLNGEPLNPTIIDLEPLTKNSGNDSIKTEPVSLYFKFFDEPLKLPIMIEQKKQ